MSVSTASKTISTQLTDTSFFTTTPNEFFQCMSFNVKMILALSFTVLLLCVFMSCLNIIFPPIDDSEIRYNPALLKKSYLMCKCKDEHCKCKSNIPLNDEAGMEMFSNDEMYSFKEAQESSYQSIPLLDPKDENLF